MTRAAPPSLAPGEVAGSIAAMEERVMSSPREPPFRFEIVPASAVDRCPDGIGRLWDRSLDGLVIKGFLSEPTLAVVLDRLAHNRPELRRRIFEDRAYGEDPPYVISRGLITAPADLVDYFADAAHFRQGCRALFAGVEDFEDRLRHVLATIGGGARIELPSGPEGQPYSPATIRVLPPDGEITVHCGNDFLRRPECAHLRGLVDDESQLSFFVPLRLPAVGGDLELYAVSWDDTDGEQRIGAVPVSLVAAFSDRMKAPVGVGDLLIFDGGRIYHRVTPVGAAERRITIGGFLGYGLDHRVLHYWS